LATLVLFQNLVRITINFHLNEEKQPHICTWCFLALQYNIQLEFYLSLLRRVTDWMQVL
jgi:hypothetical protein